MFVELCNKRCKNILQIVILYARLPISGTPLALRPTPPVTHCVMRFLEQTCYPHIGVDRQRTGVPGTAFVQLSHMLTHTFGSGFAPNYRTPGLIIEQTTGKADGVVQLLYTPIYGLVNS